MVSVVAEMTAGGVDADVETVVTAASGVMVPLRRPCVCRVVLRLRWIATRSRIMRTRA